MKNNKLPIVFLLLVVIVLFLFAVFQKKTAVNNSLVHDVTEEVEINKQKLKVQYNKGNMIDEVLTFGNKITKIIGIENTSDEVVSYALSITESEMTLNSLTYSISISDTEDGKYIPFVVDKSINEDKVLVYDLGIEPKKMQYLKVEMKANLEGSETTLKGILKVISNLSEKDVFLQKMDSIYEALEKKIKELNGINEAGYFIVDVSTLSFEESASYKGYILIDASDYSSLKYYYTVYNNKYILKHQEYPKDISKSNIVDYAKEDINFNGVCRDHTKKECRSFSDLKYREDGGEEQFITHVNKVIESVQSTFKKEDGKVFIYDVENDIQNDSNIRGYILINNENTSTPEYYLYLTNDLYMISGYNWTKLGSIQSSSATVRAYNETAFKLSSETMASVCSFSGFGECYTANGDRV